TPAPGDNNIEILSTGSAATGALPGPADPIAGSNCADLWVALPPFTGSFPDPAASGGPELRGAVHHFCKALRSGSENWLEHSPTHEFAPSKKILSSSNLAAFAP